MKLWVSAFLGLFFLKCPTSQAEEFAAPLSYQKKCKKGEILKIKITQGDYSLRLIKPKHQAFLQSLHTNPQAMSSFMYHGKARSQESFLQLFSQWCKKIKEDIPFTAYTFWNNKENKFIGYIGFDRCANNSIEVCYALMPDFWHQGYGSTILKTGCSILMDFLKQQGYLQKHHITNLIAHVSEANKASSHILQKNGFKVVEKTPDDDSPSNWIKVRKIL